MSGVSYALEPLLPGPAIFLAGPTPRDPETPSWRPGFISILQRLEPSVTIYVPEQTAWKDNYDAQVQWEWDALEASTVVLFWIPRDLKTMPAFTTNVEFGMLITTQRALAIGWPIDAPKNKYLEWHAKRTGREIYHTPEDVCLRALDSL